MLRAQTHRAVTLKVGEAAASKRRAALEARAEVAQWKAMGQRQEQKWRSKAATCREQALGKCQGIPTRDFT